MPEYTERLKIPLPLGNETVNRENYIAALQAVEDNAAALTASNVLKRQTVIQGKFNYNTNGANFLSIVPSQLKIKLWAAEVPLICTIADGFGLDLREINYVFGFDEDIEEAWTLPANKSFLQLYIEYDPTTKEKTFGYTEQETTYEYPATPVTGQHWFDKDNLWIMQRWDGVTWEKKIRLMVGEAITGASAVTSVVCYALQGRYESEWFEIESNQFYLKNSNVGTDMSLVDILVANSANLSIFKSINSRIAIYVPSAPIDYYGVINTHCSKNAVGINTRELSTTMAETRIHDSAGETVGVIDRAKIIANRGW